MIMWEVKEGKGEELKSSSFQLNRILMAHHD
jgi:hypothetical protein